MSSLLFFDPACQQPYDTRTLRERAMGGTEATVTRIADFLGAYVMQHNRTRTRAATVHRGSWTAFAVSCSSANHGHCP